MIKTTDTLISLLKKDDIILHENEHYKIKEIITLFSYPPQTRINIMNILTNKETFLVFTSKCETVLKITSY